MELMNEETKKYLFDKVYNLSEGSTILELGSCAGRSSLSMAFAAKSKKSKLICVDVWTETHYEKIFNDNLKKYNLEDTIFPYKQTTTSFLQNWKEKFPSTEFDLVFIDASHLYHDVISDFILAYDLVKIGGLILMHDVTPSWPGCYCTWHNLAKKFLINHEYQSTIACGEKKFPSLYMIY